MTPKVIFIVAASCGILSCMTSADSGRSRASGVYAREYAYEVSNPETGKKLGLRQICDSIFIERNDIGYQVSNRKWRMNDHDQEAWVSMAHSEQRPFPSFFASYDKTSKAFIPNNTSIARPLFISDGDGVLFKGSAREFAYHKIE